MLNFERHFSACRSAGFSILEVLFSLAIIGVIFGGYSYFVDLQRASRRSDQLVECNSAARSVLDTIHALGYERKRAPIELSSNRVVASPIGVVDGAHIFPESGGPELITGGETSTYKLHNYRAVLGSMAALTGIYNSNPAFCSSGAAYLGPGDLLTASMYGSTVPTKIRIERLNLETGELDCPAPPIYFQSRGETNPPQASGIVDVPANVFNDKFGLKVTVDVTPVGVLGCSSSAIFQYPRIVGSSDLNAISIDYAQQAIVTACEQRDKGQLTITLPASYAVEGLVPFCQDLSTPDPSVSPACPGGARRGKVSKNDTWKPCDKVTVCGIKPATTTLVVNQITNTYTNLPWGCNLRVKASLVDPSLNATTASIEKTFPNGISGCRPCPTGTGLGFCNDSDMATDCTGYIDGYYPGGGDGKGGDGTDSDSVGDGKDGGAW